MLCPKFFSIKCEMLAISQWRLNWRHKSLPMSTFYTVKIKNNGSRHINSIFKTKRIMVAHSSVCCYTLSYVFIYAFLLSLCVYFGSHNLLELWISSSIHTYHFTPSTFPFYLTSKTRDLLTINQLLQSPRVSAPDNLWRISQNRSMSQLIPYMTVSHWVTNYQHHNFHQQK